MPRPTFPRLDFQKIVLSNGLQLILHVDRKLPIVHVNQWYHVGSKNERPGRTGFAHLFEHLMFEGSKNAPGGYFKHVEKAGANLREGGVNGTTSEDRTNYFATVPSGNLEYLLWLESDRMATVGEYLTQENLDAQREVVRNERRQTLENQPYGRAFKTIDENLFSYGHPYSWPVIGSHEDLVAATVDDVREFFQTFYTPNNCSICIAGDFDEAATIGLVEKYFGGIPPGPVISRPRKWLASLHGEKIIEVTDRVPQERIYFVWPGPESFHHDQPALELASSVLSDGLSARLGRTLVYDRQLCSNVTAFNNSSEIAGAYMVIATIRSGVKRERVEEVIAKELAKLARLGPSLKELKRAKSKWEFDFISGLERIGGFGGKADRLNAFNTYTGDPGMTEELMRRFAAVSPADVKHVVDHWVNTDARLLVRFVPENPTKTTVGISDRSASPPFGIDRPLDIPKIETAELPNGLRVFVVERSDLPKVVVSLNVRAGSVLDAPAKAGMSHLLAATIDRGTKTRSALQIEDGFGDLGTALGGATAREFSSLSFDVLKKNLNSAMTLFSDVVLNPAFPLEEFEREKKLHQDSLKQEESNPAALAARLRLLLAFGPEHPYGHPSRGLPSTVAAIERTEVQRFHREHWVPEGASLVFVGAISLKEAAALAKKHFGRWRGSSSAAKRLVVPERTSPSQVFLVHRPDAPQAVISQMLLLPDRRMGEYYDLRLADAVWGGGGFMTRLNLNLREDKGYSYGVFSGMSLFRHAGLWFSSGSVQGDKTKESVLELTQELRGLSGEKPVTEEELQRAKTTRLRGYAQQFESLSRIAGQITELWLYDLPLDEYRNEIQAIERATAASVNSAAAKYASLERASLLLVGDANTLLPQLRDAGLNEVIRIDAEGKRIG